MTRRVARKAWTINSVLPTNPLVIILLSFLRWFEEYARQTEEGHFQGLEKMRVFTGESPTLRDDGGNYNAHKQEIRDILQRLGL